MTTERPKIKIQLTFKDKVIESIGWLFILVSWIIALKSYQSLPEIIPVHFDANGTADGFGEKWNIFTLPVVSTVLFVSLTILNKYPHIFNYAVEITDKNAERQYSNATSMMRYLKLSIAIIFAMIAYSAVRNATGESEGLGAWFLPTVLALIFLPMIYFIMKSFKNS